MWKYRIKRNLPRIASSVGNVYEILDVEGDIFTVRDSQTKTHFGYIACAEYCGVTVYGPMTPYRDRAKELAWFCAYNRFNRVKSLGDAYTNSR
ncbi:hypothetical protein HDR66_01550 [bacterium]|nr:hypothetical protein [bacterium]